MKQALTILISFVIIFANGQFLQKLKQITPAQTTLQTIFNGIFTANNLPSPTTLVQCFDATTANNLVNFINRIIPQAASGSQNDLIQLMNQVQYFYQQMPQSDINCLSTNSEWETLLAAYGMTTSTPAGNVESIVIQAINDFYSMVHYNLVLINQVWRSGNYYQAGYECAELWHVTPQKMLLDMFNGIFVQNNLSSPTQVVQCFDNQTTVNFLMYVSQTITKAAGASQNELLNLFTQVQQYYQTTFPESTKSCLFQNSQFKQLLSLYGISSSTSIDTIDTTIGNYIINFYDQVYYTINQINQEWFDSIYRASFLAAELWHQNTNFMLTQVINALFVQNSLNVPTTVMQCFDSKSIETIAKFINDALPEAASAFDSNTLQNLLNQAKQITNQLPQTVQNCLISNQEVISLYQAYGLKPGNQTVVINAFSQYFQQHFRDSKNQFQEINNNWQTTKYYYAGYYGAELGHNVFQQQINQKDIN